MLGDHAVYERVVVTIEERREEVAEPGARKLAAHGVTAAEGANAFVHLREPAGRFAAVNEVSNEDRFAAENKAYFKTRTHWFEVAFASYVLSAVRFSFHLGLLPLHEALLIDFGHSKIECPWILSSEKRNELRNEM